MKAFSPRSRFLLILLVLAAAALACQTVTQAFDRATATSSLSPTLTQPADASTQTPTEEVEATPTPTLVPLSKSEQLDIFEELWKIVDEEYLYADYNGLDWDQTRTDYQQKIEDGLSTPDFYVALDEMIFALNDDHSIYLNPQQVAAEEAEYAGNLDYVGIGVYISYLPEKQRAVILLVFPDGPAEQAGLKARDSILAVNGVPLDDEEGSAIDLLLGIEGTQVTITVQSPGENPREITLPRGRITSSIPVPHEVLLTPGGQHIGYLVIPTFTDSRIGDKVGEALEDLSADVPLDGIIIDNRLNTGGFDDVMATSLSYFVSG
ncbi:MAG: PDZ domain-containing protein, partial [Anaerolineales bacterium]